MSYIPDTYSKTKIDIYGRQKDEPNPYWYKILEGKDAEFVKGYDWAQKDVENMLENIIEDIIEIVKDDDEDFAGYTDEEKAEEIRELFNSYMYGDRNEIVVSMIESMSEDDYKRRFEAVKDLPENEADKWEDES